MRVLLLAAGLWFPSIPGAAELAGTYVQQGPFVASIDVGGTANTGSIDFAYGYGWSVAGGGKGLNGGANRNLYLTIALQPHPLYRATGHDLYLDLPLAPWEAALGASAEVPTLGGSVRLKVPPGMNTGQKLRLAKRGLPKRREGEGGALSTYQ